VYDANTEVKFELMNMGLAYKKKAKSVIESVEVGSCTNLCGGLIQGEWIGHWCPAFVDYLTKH